MSMFFNEIAEVNRAHCAALGIKTDAYRAIPRPDEFYEPATGATLAYEWITRCQQSEDEALKVLSEINTPDDFMAKVFHMLSKVETRTDRSKVINELVDSFEGALLAAANHE